MRRFLTYYLGVFVMCMATFQAHAYKNTEEGGSNSNHGNPKAAGCAPANAKTYMEFNNVRALIETGGSMWQDRSASVAAYEIPKGSGTSVIYSGSLWMGGTDVNGQLKLAAVTFRTSGNDFWPGPLSAIEGTGNFEFGEAGDSDLRRDFGQAEIIPEECIKYDELYNITRAEVRNYITYWQCQNGELVDDVCDTLTINQELLERIKNWPAHGDPSLGQDFYLAPFYDNPSGPNPSNGIYDPEVDGDYPWYDFKGEIVDNCREDRRITLFGDVTYWWVFNDKGNIHTESGADPIGMEIRAQAFAFATNDEINNMTFYNYELINRSTQTLQDTYFAQYVDADVGTSTDDYVGCDVGRGLAFAYNGDANDEASSSSTGYGSVPPAVGVDFFEGPYQDDDGIDNAEGIGENEALNGLGYGDEIIDNERYGMRKFLYYTNPSSNPPIYQQDPSAAVDFYFYMQGIWKDGTPAYYGGNGHVSQGTTLEADFMFPGSSDSLHWGTGGSDPGFAWSEETPVVNPPGDRRFLQSAGPFTLQPGAVNNITVGVVFGQKDGDLQASVSAMKVADTKAQALFDACFQIVEPPHAPNLSARELENKVVLFITNPPNSNNVNEDYYVRDRINIITPDELVAQGEVYDDTFRFEGYQVYQLSDEDVSVQDINDDSKARLVAVVDRANGIDRAVNYVYDEELDITVPYVRFDGEDEGLRHSFPITEDLFATGANRSLVNHKKYYYIAVAFAYNEYKEYDPSDPTKLDGQKQPYLRSRISASGTEIRAITVIPHKPSPENSGTMLMSDYGDGPQLTRLDGEGNGGNALEITTETELQIVNDGYMQDPTYLGGSGPVDIKVVDPFNVQAGEYQFAMTQGGDIDTADWYIVNKATNDTVYSDTSINLGNEQLILEWGISVSIKQPEYRGSGNPDSFFTDIISAETKFQDSARLWLIGVPDDDSYYPTNWIRSGSYSPSSEECTPGVCLSNPCDYADLGDPDKEYDNIIGGTIAPFKFVGYSRETSVANERDAYCPPGLAFHQPSFFSAVSAAQSKARITRLQSVDIVFTNDKSKWTRCPVLEMGIESALTEGNVGKLRLRGGSSVNKDGDPDGSGTGMGWFPGYAINLETGERLNMAFGENSALPNNNGRDMKWNPTAKFSNSVGEPVFGGMHYIYVFNSEVESSAMPSYDEGQYLYNQLSQENATAYLDVWKNCMYVGTPMLAQNQELLSNDVKISIRVSRKYEDKVVSGLNNGRPMYSFDMSNLSPSFEIDTLQENDLISFRAVPNPYYGYSEYEDTKLDTRIKFVDIPQTCTISIFNVSGSLVRRINKDDPLTAAEWDLKNTNGIPIAGGVYIIHVETPDGKVGITKWFGAMRPPNLENF